MKKILTVSIVVIILAGAGIWYGVYHAPKKLGVQNTQTATIQTVPWLSDYTAIPGGKEADLSKMITGTEYSVDLGKNTTLQFSFKPETIKYEDQVTFTYKKKDGSPESIPFVNAKTGTFIFADMNFDGYRDLVGPSTNGGVIGGDEQSEVYMYDPMTRAFVMDPVLDLYSSKTDILNSDKKFFIRSDGYADSLSKTRYDFLNNKWVITKTQSIMSVVDDSDTYDHPDVQCYYLESVLTDGAMKDTVDRNIGYSKEYKTCREYFTKHIEK